MPEITRKLENLMDSQNIEDKNPLWQKYRKNCEDQERLIHEKYETYYSEMKSNPSYAQELAEYIKLGNDLNFFAGYFTAKLQYDKFVEIMKIRQNLFKIECLRFRGFKITEADDLRVMGFYDEGSKNVKSVINNIINSSAKDYIEQNDFDNLQEILSRAADYDSLNIRFNMSSKDEALFLSIRKTLRNKLLSDDLTMYEKAFIRKIVNDIQSLIKFEFSSVKCIEDHLSVLHSSGIKRNSSNVSSDEKSMKKIKLNRSATENVDVIDKVVVDQEDQGKDCTAISENLTTQ